MNLSPVYLSLLFCDPLGSWNLLIHGSSSGTLLDDFSMWFQGAICSGSTLSASKYLYVCELFLDIDLCAVPPPPLPTQICSVLSLFMSASLYIPTIDPMEEPRLPYLLVFLITHCLLLPEALSYHFLPGGASSWSAHRCPLLCSEPWFLTFSILDWSLSIIVWFAGLWLESPHNLEFVLCVKTSLKHLHLAILFRPWKYYYPCSHAVLWDIWKTVSLKVRGMVLYLPPHQVLAQYLYNWLKNFFFPFLYFWWWGRAVVKAILNQTCS